MRLNSISPAPGSKKEKKRVGRGIGSGLGKTSGRGHKGQKARSGGSIRHGFEGGQMPLHRRLPKFGFNSRKAKSSVQICLHELMQVTKDVVDLSSLKEAGLIRHDVKRVKIIASGKVSRAVTIRGLLLTRGARDAIEAAGGKIDLC